MHIVQVNYAHDPAFPEPEALLERFVILVEWSEALLAAGARRVTVVQRFTRDLDLQRGGVAYVFRRDPGFGHPKPQPWTWPRRLHACVASLAPALVHVNGLIFPVQTWLLRRVVSARTALVIQDHANAVPADALRRALVRAGLATADGFLFTAASVARPWREAGLIRPDQPVYEVMEASRPLRPLARAAARATSGLRGEPALLWVGRLNANKDPLTVLAGFERAAPRLPNAHLTMIYATEELLPEVRARVSGSPRLRERVHLLGRLPYRGMDAFFSAADLFVLGSHHEGSGFALLEALACGAVPVVADNPSFRAMTADGALGRLWTPGDSQALATALVDLGERDLSPLRLAATAHFEREFSWAAIGRRALAAYGDVLCRRGPTGAAAPASDGLC